MFSILSLSKTETSTDSKEISDEPVEVKHTMVDTNKQTQTESSQQENKEMSGDISQYQDYSKMPTLISDSDSDPEQDSDPNSDPDTHKKLHSFYKIPGIIRKIKNKNPLWVISLNKKPLMYVHSYDEIFPLMLSYAKKLSLSQSFNKRTHIEIKGDLINVIGSDRLSIFSYDKLLYSLSYNEIPQIELKDL